MKRFGIFKFIVVTHWILKSIKLVITMFLFLMKHNNMKQCRIETIRVTVSKGNWCFPKL